MDDQEADKSFIKSMANLISMVIYGKKPENVEIDEKMSINSDGKLKEETVVKTSDSNGKIGEFVIHELTPDDDFMVKIRESYMKEVNEFYRKHFERMGFAEGFKPFGSMKQHGGYVLNMIPDIEGTDFVWLCDELDGLETRLQDDYVTHRRICKEGDQTKTYIRIKENSCCEKFDEIIENKKTGNKFWIGCNYKHKSRPSDED